MGTLILYQFSSADLNLTLLGTVDLGLAGVYGFLLPQFGCDRPGHGHGPRIFRQCCRHGRFPIPDSGRNLSHHGHRNAHSHGLQQDAAAESDSVDSDRQLITEQRKPGEDLLLTVPHSLDFAYFP